MKSFKWFIQQLTESMITVIDSDEEIQKAIVLAENIDGQIQEISAETQFSKETRNKITLIQVVPDKVRMKFAQLAKESVNDLDGYESVEITSARSEKDYQFKHESLSKNVYVLVKPSGARGAVRADPNELLTSTFAMMDFKVPSTIQELDVLIDKAKSIAPMKNSDWSKDSLDMFDKAYTNACQAMSAAIAIKKIIGGTADKGWMTGIKWGKEIEHFKTNSYGMKDFNSSDIILKKGNLWYGVSLKKKERTGAKDPTILNKAFNTLLGGKEFKIVREEIEKKTAEFYVSVIKKALTEKVIDGNPRSVNERNWKSFMKKISTEYVNKSLKTKESLFKDVANIIEGAGEEIATTLVNLVLKMDLKDLQQKDFIFSLITGIGRYCPRIGVVVEQADVKEIDTIVEKMDALFEKGKPTIEFNRTKLQAFQPGAGAAKLQYVVKVGGMDIIQSEIRYKGNFTAQPQFLAFFTEKFKRLLK